MTKNEALEAYQRDYGELWARGPSGDPTDTPLDGMKRDLSDAIAELSKADATVPQRLDRVKELGRILRTPTRIAWLEPTDEFEYHPVSGVRIPKTKRVVEVPECAETLCDIKNLFAAFVRCLAAYAKRISSPTYGEFRALYIMLAEDMSVGRAAMPLSEDVVQEVLPRVDAALFGLWADNEIEKEVKHV